jgi:hypothetical protein
MCGTAFTTMVYAQVQRQVLCLAGAGAALKQPASSTACNNTHSALLLLLCVYVCAVQVYLVFACSILEQDLMFVVYNIPTVGICRAEQRAKACQKLGISFKELGGLDYGQDNAAPPVYPAASGKNGAAAAAAYASAQQQQQQQSLKRVALGQGGWGDGMMLQDAMMGGDMAAAMAAAGDPSMAMQVGALLALDGCLAAQNN